MQRPLDIAAKSIELTSPSAGGHILRVVAERRPAKDVGEGFRQEFFGASARRGAHISGRGIHRSFQPKRIPSFNSCSSKRTAPIHRLMRIPKRTAHIIQFLHIRKLPVRRFFRICELPADRSQSSVVYKKSGRPRPDSLYSEMLNGIGGSCSAARLRATPDLCPARRIALNRRSFPNAIPSAPCFLRAGGIISDEPGTFWRQGLCGTRLPPAELRPPAA